VTIEELEAYDPHAPLQKYERRFCCPFCGDSKWKDSAHRSLAVKMETSTSATAATRKDASTGRTGTAASFVRAGSEGPGRIRT